MCSHPLLALTPGQPLHDAVVVRGPDGSEVGRGLIAYDAADAEKIRGRSSADIMLILGYTGRAEMIHRDDLVIGSAPGD